MSFVLVRRLAAAGLSPGDKGQIRSASGAPVRIDGLWGLAFGRTACSASSPSA